MFDLQLADGIQTVEAGVAETEMSEQWRRCSSCKKPIDFGAGYWVCNVSTCNRRNAAFVFCTVSCWDAHLGIVRHRESWAEERTAPTKAEHQREQGAVGKSKQSPSKPVKESPHRAADATRPPRRIIPETKSTRADSNLSNRDVPIETLIVTSKLKQYVKARSGLNTSDRVVGPLSDAVRKLCDEAIEEAIANERKTLLDRDFKK